MSDDRFKPPEAPLREARDETPRGHGRGLPDVVVVAGGLLLTKLTSYSVAPAAADILASLVLPLDSGSGAFAMFLIADVLFSFAVVLGFLVLARTLSLSGDARVIHWLAGLLFVSTPLVRLWLGEYAALAEGRGFPLWYELTLLLAVPGAWLVALRLTRRRGSASVSPSPATTNP